MTFRIAVDTGGTFSDVVITNTATRQLWIDKALTTYDRVFDGISAALTAAAGDIGTDLRGLLSQTSLFTYGTTFSTNAIITGDVARTAFLTTQGHPDTLVLREGGKLNPFDFRHPYPDPYIPRRLTFEVPERIDAEGGILIPLDETRVAEIAADLRGVEAVAVCLLWSIVNPAHELRVAEILARDLPGVPVTLSHQINPILREYRRASSAAIDASLKPLMQRHLREMETDLRRGGFDGQLLVGTSFGGVLGVEDVAARPIYTVNSAPAMAPVAGRANAPDEDSIIVCDMGGTSFDVSIVRDGNMKFTRETWIGGQYTGHMTGLSAVDIRNIGAGGGSIAWIDPGGLLHVGPQSAKSTPGPACYGQGGTWATVTDASLVMGHIDPDFFLGGRMRLDPAAAERAIRMNVAEPLGIGLHKAAHAILTIATENMVNAIRSITVNEGLDPRKSLLIAGGGAGGMTIGRIAELLGSSRALVPRTAGTLSASGGLFSDIVTEFSASRRADTRDFDHAAVNAELARLDAQIDAFFDRIETPKDRQAREFLVEARYPQQIWELDVPLRGAAFAGREDVEAMIAGFHAAHERVFAVSEPGQGVECIGWKARAIARLPRPRLERGAQTAASAEPLAVGQSWFGGDSPEPTARYDGANLPAGTILQGPCIILEPTTTIVVFPGWTATVLPNGDYMMAKEC
ncbi:hydantoinase/oxoprolinase family protein [Ruixingdingia sedimenti]|uniref:Hydantoinase/oxoprolinase family protein n=1 Tax=Ruixingdingia sedimenti TaxID=3073604 RepID=A0ABU1F3M5_9RHOB|nr:hydantoinase/oxoprolinase family protein [Xinfangfangia sp. LG-4]MDR5651461.1 hydantoinase/oxoprolinase family protein [Xinfangfangia sp. LG-4]